LAILRTPIYNNCRAPALRCLALNKDAVMQRNAASILALLTLGVGMSIAQAQVITAQPARTLSASPPSSPNYSAGFSSAYPPTLSAASLAQSPEANTIRGWYRDYLGRDVGQDLTALANLMRGGMSPTDLQATILGSDEFYSQKGNDPQSFVRQTLQAVTWTEPSYSDVQRWTDRLTQLRGDRFALAREILLSNAQPQSQVNQQSDLVTRLSSATRLAVDTINFEIGGTPQGQQANLQVRELQNVINQLQQSTSVGAPPRPDDLAYWLNGADRAYQALQTTLSNPPGAAPSAAGVVRRIGSMLADLRTPAGGASLPPIANYPPVGGTLPPGTLPSSTLPSSTGGLGYASPQQLLDQIAAARRATESLIQTLTSQTYQDYTYNVVLRDLDTLASRLAGLDPLVRSGMSQDRLQWEVQSILDSGDRVRSQLTANRLPYSARLYWQSVESSLAQLRDSLGVANTPSSTTMLRPTAFHDSLLPLLDQAASQIDVFVAGTTPLVYSIADVPSVQADVRSLKNRVILMRQQAGMGQPATVLKQTLSGMVIDYQDAFDRWNRIVANSRPYNPARLSPVGETLNRVEQLINQALASGSLTPAGPTRVSQDLVQLNAEVADARRGLGVLAGYREQQSVDLYLGQLADYAQQINDALTRQTTVDARRLAVGMQGVVGRLQADISSVNQRATGGLTPNLQQPVTDLQFRADRIGRLVDDVESQLY
jgi:hypothetical protein